METQENNLERPPIELIEPSVKYKDSYIEALKEYREIDGDKLDIDEREKNFDSFIQRLEADKVIDSEDKVPNIRYWLVKDNRYIGRISYRPKLNDVLKLRGGNVGYSIRPSERGKGYATELVKEIKQKAKEDGLTELLITCNTDNIPSAKVIEKNGGVYTDSSLDKHGAAISRYIVPIN